MKIDNWISPPHSFDLESHHVDIWRISLDPSADSVKFNGSTLSAEECEKASRFLLPADRNRFIVAHGTLREILGRYLHCKPSELTFSVNHYGKPRLVDSKLEFNLSHSGGFVLITVTYERHIGVDVERIRTDMELEKIASHNFSKNEISELMALPPKQRAVGFFNCWTRKEAYIKAHGLGLSLALESFDVSLAPDGPAILRATRPDPQEAARWTLLSLNVDPNYAGALAVDGHDLEFRLWDGELAFHK